MRARITFSKTGAQRYIGHLDLQTLWERAARRAGLPLAYSHGFHPQPKITFASALPLGFSSRAEVMDIRLQSDMSPNDLPRLLKDALPPGIDILAVEQVDEGEPALQVQIQSAEYQVTPIEPLDADQLRRGVERILQAESLPRTRRQKSYDLRPLIEELRVGEMDGKTGLSMRLAAREGATGRPEEVLSELGIAANDARIERTRLIFQR
ncbi:MAG: TIGR03936 family radical SAM-associated protein [Anaerolineae bacterium]